MHTCIMLNLRSHQWIIASIFGNRNNIVTVGRTITYTMHTLDHECCMCDTFNDTWSSSFCSFGATTYFAMFSFTFGPAYNNGTGIY